MLAVSWVSTDGRGNVRWPGRHEDVGTDYARIDVVHPQFIEAFDMSPLANDGALIASEGYAATPLTACGRTIRICTTEASRRCGTCSDRRIRTARRLRSDGRPPLRPLERVGQVQHASDATRGLSETALAAARPQRSRLVRGNPSRQRQRRPRLLEAHPDRRTPPRADRVSQDALSALPLRERLVVAISRGATPLEIVLSTSTIMIGAFAGFVSLSISTSSLRR